MAAPGHLKILNNTLDRATRGDTITVMHMYLSSFLTFVLNSDQLNCIQVAPRIANTMKRHGDAYLDFR